MNAQVKFILAARAAEFAERRVGRYDWRALSTELRGYGCAVIEKLLTPDECKEIASLYSHEEPFRSHIHLANHGFGKGEYRYFKYPLPGLLETLRTALYPRLASVANDWNDRMGIDQRYPDRHSEFLKLCHDAGQTRPTPLLLQYVPVTSTACIRISTVNWRSHCRWRSYSPNRARISRAASSF